MARRGVTFDEFKAAWLRLEAAGHATIATVNAEIGGSNQTLMKFRDRLRKEQETDMLQGLDLPVKVRQSIFGFAEQHTQSIQKQLTERINDISDYQKEIEHQAKCYEEEKTQWTLLRQAFEKQVNKLEKTVAVREAQLDDAKAGEQALRNENKALLEQRHTAEKAQAIAETETKGYLARIKVLEDELKAARNKS